MKKLFEITQKPLLKTIISILVPTLIGIISSVYTNAITTINGVEFLLSYQKISFYILIILSLLTFSYYYLLYKFESTVLKYADKDFCISYMRSQLLPELADRYKKRIRSGQSITGSETMEDFMRFLNQ